MSRPKKEGRGSKPQWAAAAQRRYKSKSFKQNQIGRRSTAER